jgi:hypothetical protein
MAKAAGLCAVHLKMPEWLLDEDMQRTAGMVEPLECIAHDSIEYETTDGRRYMHNKDGSRRYMS